MRIEISAGGLAAGVAVAEYQDNIASFISDVDNIISGFKAVTQKVCDLAGGVGSLQSAVDDISQRIWQEESKKETAVVVQTKSNGFLELAMRVDKQVAAAVNQNREEFYQTNPWLKPPPSADELPWYEQAWNWACDTGEQIAEGLKQAWEWTKDTAKKAWAGLVDFYQEHWYGIVNWGVTILCAVGSIAAIALIPVTGGASILVVAGVSAISGAIVASTRSITTQQRDTGTINWSEVGKDAAIAAAVGAVTGAIGAGVGGAITNAASHTGLGAALLNSSSTSVRMLTGAAIGSTSEVVSGMVTRGAAEATESYLETGNVEFGDIWDAAFDPQQMALDAAIGGASGGFDAAKAPKTADTDAIDWERTSNTADEERILREMEVNGELEVNAVNPSLKEPVKQSPHLPKKSGTFSGEIGNSAFVPNDSAALAKMQEFGANSVPYVNYDADFSAFTKHDSPWGIVDGKVEIGHMTGQRANGTWEFGRRPAGTSHDPTYDLGNFAQADNAVAKQFEGSGITGKDIEKFRSDNHLIWHESADGKTMMLVPEEIHKACPHSGGVSEMKYRMAWGDVRLDF